MKVLIAGGSGFLGTALINSLKRDNHQVITLTRRTPQNPDQAQWDGKTIDGWGYLVNEMDAIIHLTGFGLEHWPWTIKQKQKFIDSRVIPGLALASAIQNASHGRGKLLNIDRHEISCDDDLTLVGLAGFSRDITLCKSTCRIMNQI